MRILLVEDDEKLNLSLRFQLEKENFTVDSCFDGEVALFHIKETMYDLILLDRMLPIISGLEVLRRLRLDNIATPVILLTALGEVQDKITGLDCGADDYLVKPFDFDELCARIRCVARRPRQISDSKKLCFADLTLDTDSLTLLGSGGSCSLSKKEAQLLETFLRHPRQSLSRSALLTHVWGPDSDVEEGNLDNYVYFLRRRLKTVNSRVLIRTVRGVGYCMEEGS